MTSTSVFYFQKYEIMDSIPKFGFPSYMFFPSLKINTALIYLFNQVYSENDPNLIYRPISISS